MASSLPSDVYQHMRSLGFTDPVISQALPIAKEMFEQMQVESAPSLLDSVQHVADIVKRFEKSKDSPPRKITLPSRGTLLREHEGARRIRSGCPEEGSVLLTFDGDAKEVSVATLEDLKPISLKELLVNKRHTGSYLLARVIGLPFKIIGVCPLIEDENGDAVVLSIYNSEAGTVAIQADVDALYPLGTLVLVKEPSLKESLAAEGRVHIRVDSPGDVVFLEPNHPLSTAAKWRFPDPTPRSSGPINYRSLGNDLFKQKKFLLAEKKYSEGIQHVAGAKDVVELALLHLNRAAASLKIEHYSSAYDDSTEVLKLLSDDDHIQRKKALLRKATALEGMRLTRRSLDAFQVFSDQYPGEPAAKEGIQRLSRKIRESESGNYDWKELFVGAGPHDVGDFIGPIRIQEMAARGGGRGIVATRDIKVGELLVVEKALAIGESSPTSPSIIYSIDLLVSTITGPTTMHLEAKDLSHLAIDANLLSRLMDDPSLSHLVGALYGGSHFPSICSPPIIKISDRLWPAVSVQHLSAGRVEAINNQNCFGSSHQYVSGPSGTETSSPDIPKTGWTYYDDFIKDECVQSSRWERDSALFVQTSLFNHDCVPNGCWTRKVDTIIVRARTDIAAGCEIFISYDPLDDTGAERKALEKHFPDGCLCRWCDEERPGKGHDLSGRLHLLKWELPPLKNKVNSQSRINSTLVKQVEKFLAALEATYPTKHSSFKPHLFDPYQLMSKAYFGLGRKRDAITYGIKTLAALGVTIVALDSHKVEIVLARFSKLAPVRAQTTSLEACDSAGKIFLYICGLFLEEQLKELAKSWMQMALAHEKLSVGGGKEVFKMRQQETLGNAWCQNKGVLGLLAAA